MKSVAINLAGMLGLGLILAACSATTEKPAGVPEKVAGVQEVTITEMAPDDQLFRALEFFARNETVNCANEIKEAAKFTRELAATATEKRKHAIEAAAESLENLAGKVERNEVKDIAQLNKTFGMTGRALAGNRLSITEMEYFKNSEQDSGELLANTITQLEKSIIIHHRALSELEKQTLKDASDVAARLEKGEKVDEDDFKATLQSIDTEIDKWNKEFKSL